MSRDAMLARKYEKERAAEALRRLLQRVDCRTIPLADVELKTLAKRWRQSFYGSPHSRERLRRYQAHLAMIHGDDTVSALATKFHAIINEMGWEEKEGTCYRNAPKCRLADTA